MMRNDFEQSLFLLYWFQSNGINGDKSESELEKDSSSCSPNTPHEEEKVEASNETPASDEGTSDKSTNEQASEEEADKQISETPKEEDTEQNENLWVVQFWFWDG